MIGKNLVQMAALPAIFLGMQGCKCDCPCNCEEQPKASQAKQESVTKPQAHPQGAVNAQAQQLPLPPVPQLPKGAFLPCERVFTVPTADGTDHLVLGGSGDILWAARSDGELLWRVRGEGVPQLVVSDGEQLYVAWGMGRDHLTAPFTLTVHELKFGHQVRELWRRTGDRTEAADLQWAKLPGGDGKGGELYLSVYVSKYMVELHRFTSEGQELPVPPAVRMATSWIFADFDGDNFQDALIGRVYGDEIGLEGDLKLASGFEKSEAAQAWSGAKMIPTEHGVRALALGQISKDVPALFVSDGWMSNYGQLARGNLAVVPFTKGEPQISYLSRTAEEFSYFEIYPIDLDGDGTSEVVTRGNKFASVFSKQGQEWSKRVLTSVGPISNSAVGRRADGGYNLYLPSSSGARAIAIEK